ncbi:MAG: TIGR01212 family radical SAM protein [Bacteroidales bacterium]|nr:MAG: TIGR01212 family radical SAM protein [Bacteroidales bacterium]
MIFPWGHNRRFNAYTNYLRKQFGCRVQKVSIDAGFTCPNRDGTKGTGGCTFCNNDAFNPSYCKAEKSIRQQILEGIQFHETRYKTANKYLAYFQAYSNTYKPLRQLKEIYNQALNNDRVVGLVIGTRPDCVDNEKLKYFKVLSENFYIVVEYGIESCNNNTLKRINRGHTFEETVKAINDTVAMGIRTGAHMIFGLPGESREEMLNSAKIISKLPLSNIKFHQLQIVKDTAIAEEYKRNPGEFNIFDINEYLDFMVGYVELLNPAFIVERIAGEVPPEYNMGIKWGLRYDQVLEKFEKKLEERNTWQGRLYNG